MSVRKQIYDLVKTALLTTSIKQVEIWNNQYTPENIVKHKQPLWPVATIEFYPMNSRPPKLRTRNTNIIHEVNTDFNITIHILHKSILDETDYYFSIDQTIEDVRHSLMDLSGDNFGRFKVLIEDYDKSHDQIFDYQMTFNCLIQKPGIKNILVDANNPIGTITDIIINGSYE